MNILELYAHMIVIRNLNYL